MQLEAARVVDDDAGSRPFNVNTDQTREPHSTLIGSPYKGAFDPADTTIINKFYLAGGNDTTASTGEFMTAWEQFRNPDDIDVNILIMACPRTGINPIAIANKMIDIAEDRADCIAVLDPPYNANTPMKILTWKKKNWNPNTSYAALYWPWFKIYDRFLDREIWVPPSTWVSYVYALTDYTREPWFAPAGLNRGIVRALDLQYKASQGERDMMYMTNINPIAFFPGEGTAIWGQKTLQAKASALDRVNVRRLMLVLEKAVAKAAKYILFEPNDRFTRKMFTHMVEPFLRDVQGRRGIYYYKVICDDSNNPGVVIARNELVMDIYIQPTMAAEFITLKFNILRTGVTAEELVG
jgi:phage tail sheath protein FI